MNPQKVKLTKTPAVTVFFYAFMFFYFFGFCI